MYGDTIISPQYPLTRRLSLVYLCFPGKYDDKVLLGVG